MQGRRREQRMERTGKMEAAEGGREQQEDTE